MRAKFTEKSSILLLGRSTVIIGAVVITAVSFILGYFLGYKGGDLSPAGKQVAGLVKDRETAKADEKKVLEAPPIRPPVSAPEKPPESSQDLPIVVPPQVGKGEAVRVPAPSRSGEEAVTPAELEEEARKARENSSEPKKKRGKAPVIAGNDSEVKEPVAKEPDDQVAKSRKSSAKAPAGGAKAAGRAKEAVKKQAQAAHQKLYAVQVGAFPNKEGAENQVQKLKSLGFSSYIVDASGDDMYFRVRVGSYKDKREAEKSSAALSKQTGLQNFVTLK